MKLIKSRNELKRMRMKKNCMLHGRGNKMKIIINKTQRGTTETAREMRAMQFMSVFSCFFLPSNSQLKWKCAKFAVRCVLNQFLVRAGNVEGWVSRFRGNAN